MAFCANCGKEIKDGEVCSCQSTNTTSKVDVKNVANGFVGTAKAIIADPKAGAKAFVDGISWITMGIMAALYAIITVLFNVIDKIKANIDYRNGLEESADRLDMDLDDYIDDFNIDESIYEFGDIMKGVFTDILYIVGGIAITAVVFYFAIKLIKKTTITWKTAFAIAVIELMIFVPLVLVNELLGLLPSFKLLSWIMSAISSVRSWGCTILTFLAVKSVCGDTKSTVYVSVPSIAVCSIATSLMYLLFNF